MLFRSGKKIFLSLDLKSLDYKLHPKKKFETIEQAKGIDDLRMRIANLINAKDEIGEFYRKSFFSLFEFVSSKVGEIASDLLHIDEALEAGFGWEIGPFKTWDALGLKESIATMKAMGFSPAKWIDEMLVAGVSSFYKFENGSTYFYDPLTKSYNLAPNQNTNIALYPLRKEKTIWKNNGCNIIDIGEDVI